MDRSRLGALAGKIGSRQSDLKGTSQAASASGGLRVAEKHKVTACNSGSGMAKKRISGTDLGWLISEELLKLGSLGDRVTVAIVPDEEYNWRVIVANRVRRFLSADDKRQLAEIQRRLRMVYELRS